MSPRLVLFSCVAIVMASSACASRVACSSFTVVAPIVTVTDATTGQRICDATIVVRGSNAKLEPASDCTYAGSALATPGTYTLDVSKPGYQPASADAEVRSQSCNDTATPSPQQVTAALRPI